MYSDLFDTEGIVSSPSYGAGNKEEILRMIGLYGPGPAAPEGARARAGLARLPALHNEAGAKGGGPALRIHDCTEGLRLDSALRPPRRPRPLYVLVGGEGSTMWRRPCTTRRT